MADKEKRLRKLLNKINIKGKLKTVKTLDEASVIIIMDPHTIANSFIYDKAGYQTALSRGKTFPEDMVHFLTPINPRNKDLVTHGILLKARGLGNKSITK